MISTKKIITKLVLEINDSFERSLIIIFSNQTQGSDYLLYTTM